MIDKVREQVTKLLDNDNSGHGMDHIDRVLKLSLKFAEKENADKEVVALIALLHDVDDYKLFGKENAENLSNAKKIMSDLDISENIQSQVLSSLKRIGYNKSLRGIRPESLEGKIVSDADMCDALGVNGVIRVYTYSLKNEKPFFDRSSFPIKDINVEQYTGRTSDSSVCHMFEKILKLKGLMLTNSGKQEAEGRQKIVVDMLYQLFEEENAPEWTEYLNEFLKSNDIKI